MRRGRTRRTGPVGVRTVIVSTFPPSRHGIARYADQRADAVTADGPVVRLGLPGGGGDRVVRLAGHLRPLRLLGHAGADDVVEVMWHPEYFVTGRLSSRVLTYFALGLVARRRRMVVVYHEPDRPASGAASGVRRRALDAEERVRAWFWRGVAEVRMHTASERGGFLARFTGVPGTTVTLIEHGADFVPASTLSQGDARRSLGVPESVYVFLCIGLIGEHKGFDRAMRAFTSAQLPEARLYVVGAPPNDTEALRAHVRELERLAQADGITFINRYVDDDEFDRWILASDTVVLPYRSIASSGVAARAHLLSRHVICSAVGGLPEQARSNSAVFESEQELPALFQVAASKRRS